jgi:hypothetical protein
VHAATVSLAPSLGGARAIRSGVLVALTVLLLAMVAGLAWWAWTNPATETGGKPIPLPAVAASEAAAPPLPSTAQMAEAPAPSIAAASSTAPAVAVAPRSSGLAPRSAAVTPSPSAKPIAVADVDTAPATVAPAAPVPATRPPTVSVAANPDPQAAQQRQAQAARETLAQAQTLWNAGSHDAATDLLQQALALAQNSPAATPSNGLVVASLARELARMQLADGRAAAALEMLTRLEPLVGRDADVWAMRANAAQRLARHQDSVQAYAMALQLRPSTQRWLLGSAVSLAALGQTLQAGEMVTKARALGPVSPEVLAYLRQSGVPLGEP